MRSVAEMHFLTEGVLLRPEVGLRAQRENSDSAAGLAGTHSVCAVVVGAEIEA